ncbi:MAG: single-stranded DNA-binding protein [Bacteroidota bacterium]
MRLLINSVQLIGNLAEPPELRLTSDGTYVANMKLRSFGNAGGLGTSNQQYFHLVAWGKLAVQMEQRFCKGSRILVRGELRNRLQKREHVHFYRTEIHLHEFLALEKGANEPLAEANFHAVELA